MFVIAIHYQLIQICDTVRTQSEVRSFVFVHALVWIHLEIRTSSRSFWHVELIYVEDYRDGPVAL